jgi:anti-sigma-K factor RskA
MADLDDRLEELLPFYALDALSDEEREQVEAYLDANPAARARLAEMQQAADALPFVATPVEPPIQLKASLMARIEADARVRFPAQRESSAKSGRLARLFQPRASFAFAGLCLIVAVGALAWALTLNTEMTRLRDDVAALREEVADQNELLADIARPGVQTMQIVGTEIRPEAHGNLIANPDTESAIVLLGGLSQPEPGKVYQFWLIRGDEPVSAGTFTVDDQGRAALVITAQEAIRLFDAVGVSIEPEGGSPQPTGDIVMLSTL